MQKTVRLLTAWALFAGFTAGLGAQAPEVPLSFPTPEARSATVVQPAPGSYRVVFHPAAWPNLRWRATTPWDWSASAALALTVRNPGPQAVTVGVRIDDDPAADGRRFCTTSKASIPGRGTLRLVAPLVAHDPLTTWGMRAGPPPPGTEGLPPLSTTGSVDPRHIVAVQVFLYGPTGDVELELSDPALVPGTDDDPTAGIVDAFGQYSRAEWPGKVHSGDEIRASGTRERLDLDAHPMPPDRDQWGGWAKGPLVPATGFFHTVHQDGRWWLVDPEGRLFLSFGVDALRPSAPTIVHPRDPMFAELPSPGEALARYYGRASGVLYGGFRSGTSFDFFSANLERKFGPGFLVPWRTETLDRLVSWGFNTVGNWSEPGLGQAQRVPYTVGYAVGGPHARLASPSDYWGPIHDPFDPQFAADCARAFQNAAGRRDDPWLLGWFVDNELSWTGVVPGTLGAPADQPAKKALVAGLRARYPSIEALNQSWKTSFPSWEALGPTPADGHGSDAQATDAQKADLSAFALGFARRYFTVVRDALRAVDPHHLYLGCRFSQLTPEALQAANEVCDVVSFNVYRPTVDPGAWNPGPLEKPALVGEFHFGALDRGMFHAGLVPTASQADRADAFVRYVASVVANPRLVGAHWFEYTDEPLTGRVLDGENYNIGFVTVADVPYPELVDAARSALGRIYDRP